MKTTQIDVRVNHPFTVPAREFDSLLRTIDAWLRDHQYEWEDWHVLLDNGDEQVHR